MAENGGVIALIVLLAAISIGGFIYCRQKKLSIFKQMGEDCKNDKVYKDVNRAQKVSIIGGILGIIAVLAITPFGPASEEEQEKIFIEWASGVMNEPYYDDKNWEKIIDTFTDDGSAQFRKNAKRKIEKLKGILSELDEFEKKLSKLKVPSRLSPGRREKLTKVVDGFKTRVKTQRDFCNLVIEYFNAYDKKDGAKLKELDKMFDEQGPKLKKTLDESTIAIVTNLTEVGFVSWDVLPIMNEEGTWFWEKSNQINASQDKKNTSAPTPKTPATNSLPTTSPATSKPQTTTPANSGSTVSMEPKSPEQILQLFHQNITNKDYRKAYHFLSKDFQASASYDAWAAGFRTTISSTVSDVKVESQTGGQTVLTYTLKAVDNPGGTKYFRGTAVFIWTDAHGWRIDDMTNKPM